MGKRSKAAGADHLAKKYAHANSYKCVEINANWDLYGKSADHNRNAEMHNHVNELPLKSG